MGTVRTRMYSQHSAERGKNRPCPVNEAAPGAVSSGMIPFDSIGHVAWPRFTGDHYFAIFGSCGYERAVLAPSEASFLRSAARVIESGKDKVVHAPQILRVVSLSPAWTKTLSRPYNAAVEKHYEQAVRSRANDYYETFQKVPPGFRRTRLGKMRWDGKIPLSETFRGKVESPAVSPIEGGASVAAADAEQRRVHRVYAESWDRKTCCRSVDEWPEALFDGIPLFFCVVLADVAGIIAPLLDQAQKAHVERRAREDVAEVERRAMLEIERRADLRAFFAHNEETQ